MVCPSHWQSEVNYFSPWVLTVFTCNIASFSKWHICIGFFFCPERYKCPFQLFPSWNLLYVYLCPAYRPTSCSNVMMQGEGRGMSQHELGITFVSLRQLQGSTKFLGRFVKILWLLCQRWDRRSIRSQNTGYSLGKDWISDVSWGA